MINKKLGKISACDFGFGGYQDAMIGYSFTLSSKDWSVQDFIGVFRDRMNDISSKAMMVHLGTLLIDAKVQHFKDLVGVPVEVTFEGMRLSSWRILKEVV